MLPYNKYITIYYMRMQVQIMKKRTRKRFGRKKNNRLYYKLGKKRLSVLGICAVCIGIVCGCAMQGGQNRQTTQSAQLAQQEEGKSLPKLQQPISKTAVMMDTVVSITLYEGDETLLEDCMAYCETLAAKLDNYADDSEISALNTHPEEMVSLSDTTLALLRLGQSYEERSGGKFSIRLGALCTLWDFHEESAYLPKQEEIEKALQAANESSLEIGKDAVCLHGAGAAVDLGGIAKGYLADCLKSYMQEKGVTSAIINLGGNVLTIGNKPDGSRFVVGIQKPFAKDGEVMLGVRTEDSSVVTSGVYQRYFEQDGKRYHHILDVETGYPSETDLYSVSVLSKNSADGDALSTICMLYGLEAGLALIEDTPDVEAIFITDENKIIYSDGITEDMILK